MRPILGLTTIPRRRFAFAAALLAGALLNAGAHAESAYCTDLRAQIAKAGQEGMAARYRAAAAKQRQEYGKLAQRARSLGCDRQQFLFFGEPPPPQCDGVNARLSSLQGSIAAYDQGASDDSQRQALMARYEVQCRSQRPPADAAARAAEPRSFFEELFGVNAPDQTTGWRQDNGPTQETEPLEDQDGENPRPQGGPMAICVRSCDGGFFPITYTAKRAQLDDLNELCKAMCPGAEAKLYTQSQWKGLDSAISIDGEAYSDHPSAHRFETVYDPTCGCKPPGQSWTEALAEAERMLAERNKKDQMVTTEQAEQLSRPILPGDPRAKKALGPTPAAGEPSPPPLAAGSVTTGAPEVFRDVVGPDGVKRRVRVVAPTL
jgi:Protein of unknown function (DUF2865)